MAQTYTKVSDTVSGNKRECIYIVQASTSASGAVQTPLGYVVSTQIAPLSCASVGWGIIVKPNLDSASATKNGSVFISSTTSGDDFYLVCYGKA